MNLQLEKLTEVIAAVELASEVQGSPKYKQALGQLKSARTLIIQELKETGTEDDLRP